jgi:serine/threonine protein phosphatase PrpC
MKLSSYCHTISGRRPNNQDACVADADLGLYVVADGMGGYAGGEVASAIAISTITRFVARNLGDDDLTWPYGIDRSLSLDENMVAVGSRLANDEIVARRVGELAQMGSTLAALVARGESAVISHVGDSRVYLLRAGRLEQLTRDHSLAEQMREWGEEPAASFGHIVTRALGAGGCPEVRTEELVSGDRYLLCTDGLSGVVDGDELAALLGRGDPARCCRDLVDEAWGRGSTDNITAVVVDVL